MKKKLVNPKKIKACYVATPLDGYEVVKIKIENES